MLLLLHPLIPEACARLNDHGPRCLPAWTLCFARLCSLSARQRTSRSFPAISDSTKASRLSLQSGRVQPGPSWLSCVCACTTRNLPPFVLTIRTSTILRICTAFRSILHLLNKCSAAVLFEQWHSLCSCWLHCPLLVGGWLWFGAPLTSPPLPLWQINSVYLRRVPDKRGVDRVSFPPPTVVLRCWLKQNLQISLRAAIANTFCDDTEASSLPLYERSIRSDTQQASMPLVAVIQHSVFLTSTTINAGLLNKSRRRLHPISR